MNEQIRDTIIHGVKTLRPTKHTDARGAFFEAFRASWFDGVRPWVQWNISRSAAGVLRGLHFHEMQTDYWIVTDGTILVGLVDVRPNSPSHRTTLCLEMTGDEPSGLIIPPGVAHGYRAMRDATVMYLLDQEYSGGDEFGLRWDDPELRLSEAWYSVPPPIISSRDAHAPGLAELQHLGRFQNLRWPSGLDG